MSKRKNTSKPRSQIDPEVKQELRRKRLSHKQKIMETILDFNKKHHKPLALTDEDTSD